MPDNSDRELVERSLAGETSAYEALVSRYEDRIHVLAIHSGAQGVADDIVQDAFVLAFGKLHSLRKPESFGSWLYKIALRLCADRGARQPESAVPVETLSGHGKDDPGHMAASAESREIVRNAVASLPEHYRVTVVLRFFSNMSCDEIAEHLDEPGGTIRTRLHRASRLLRERLVSLVGAGWGGGL